METRIKEFSQFYEDNSSIVAAALFGSRARGDHEEASDTDILLVTPDTKPKHILEVNFSLSFYPQNQLIQKAESGDLFVCHIVYEAQPLHDQNGFFECLKKQFRFRDSYSQEIEHASDLGWFLVHYSKTFENHTIMNKRIAWCVRTILIAHSAEKKNPIFAASKLAESIEDNAVKKLISNKDADRLDRKSISEFMSFLESYATSSAGTKMSAHKYLSKFRTSENKVALNTFRALLSEEHLLSYD